MIHLAESVLNLRIYESKKNGAGLSVSLISERDMPHTREPTEVEVIVVSMTANFITVRTDEDSKPIKVPRENMHIVSTSGLYATISLPENTAIAYNLV